MAKNPQKARGGELEKSSNGKGQRSNALSLKRSALRNAKRRAAYKRRKAEEARGVNAGRFAADVAGSTVGRGKLAGLMALAKNVLTMFDKRKGFGDFKLEGADPAKVASCQQNQTMFAAGFQHTDKDGKLSPMQLISCPLCGAAPGLHFCTGRSQHVDARAPFNPPDYKPKDISAYPAVDPTAKTQDPASPNPRLIHAWKTAAGLQAEIRNVIEPAKDVSYRAYVELPASLQFTGPGVPVELHPFVNMLDTMTPNGERAFVGRLDQPFTAPGVTRVAGFIAENNMQSGQAWNLEQTKAHAEKFAQAIADFAAGFNTSNPSLDAIEKPQPDIRAWTNSEPVNPPKFPYGRGGTNCVEVGGVPYMFCYQGNGQYAWEICDKWGRPGEYINAADWAEKTDGHEITDPQEVARLYTECAKALGLPARFSQFEPAPKPKPPEDWFTPADLELAKAEAAAEVVRELIAGGIIEFADGCEPVVSPDGDSFKIKMTFKRPTTPVSSMPPPVQALLAWLENEVSATDRSGDAIALTGGERSECAALSRAVQDFYNPPSPESATADEPAAGIHKGPDFAKATSGMPDAIASLGHEVAAVPTPTSHAEVAALKASGYPRGFPLGERPAPQGAYAATGSFVCPGCNEYVSRDHNSTDRADLDWHIRTACRKPHDAKRALDAMPLTSDPGPRTPDPLSQLDPARRAEVAQDSERKSRLILARHGFEWRPRYQEFALGGAPGVKKEPTPSIEGFLFLGDNKIGNFDSIQDAAQFVLVNDAGPAGGSDVGASSPPAANPPYPGADAIDALIRNGLTIKPPAVKS